MCRSGTRPRGPWTMVLRVERRACPYPACACMCVPGFEITERAACVSESLVCVMPCTVYVRSAVGASSDASPGARVRGALAYARLT